MKYFVDSNVFLRVFVRENEKTFQDCLAFLELIEKKKIKAITSALVLAEIDWVLEGFYNFSREKAIEALESIAKLRGLKVSDKLDLLLALQYYRAHKIKFIDALIAAQSVIERKQLAIVSYDKDFDKLKIKRLEPADLLKQ